MQRHKSTEKRARQNKKANVSNRMARSRIKTAVTKVLEAKDKTVASEALKSAYSILDKSVKTKLIHANNAANKKGRLSKHVSKMKD